MVNIPFLILRLIVKRHTEEAIISVMIIKNAIVIAAAARELFHLYVAFLGKKDPSGEGNSGEKGGGGESGGGGVDPPATVMTPQSTTSRSSAGETGYHLNNGLKMNEEEYKVNNEINHRK